MTSTDSDNTKQIQIPAGYWIKHPLDNGFTPVTKEEFVIVERANGFTNTLGQPEEPATAAFAGPDGVRGTTIEPDIIEPERRFDIGINYFDRSGKPITVEQWGEAWKTSRILAENAVNDEPGTAYVRTMYLGFVDGFIDGAQLYGTVLSDTIPTSSRNILDELETYNSATLAYVGHHAHLAAVRNRFHCRHCQALSRTYHPRHPNS